ncbi:hypothetical protein CDD81_6610 [Ophiocordyceps australis]|uniref:Large ribosomal subunit protein mL49 n=1 Tax=Ophiocordyceps australis TaxID=1399860 RepID=A0A2C5Y6N0_9HYPO|nr:hypothetical protein CDD81_6610 [Ophiocordyceps australis]
MNRIVSRALCQVPRALLGNSVPRQTLIPRRLFHNQTVRLSNDIQDKELAAAKKANRPIEVPPPPTLSPEELAKAPYVIRRTATGGLPAYRKNKSDGTSFIIVKKVDGDVELMMKDLTEYLKVPEGDIHRGVSPGQVIVKNHVKNEQLRTWMIEKGF